MFLPSGAFMSKEITKKKVSNDSYSVVVCLPVGGPLLTRDRGSFFKLSKNICLMNSQWCSHLIVLHQHEVSMSRLSSTDCFLKSTEDFRSWRLIKIKSQRIPGTSIGAQWVFSPTH